MIADNGDGIAFDKIEDAFFLSLMFDTITFNNYVDRDENVLTSYALSNEKNINEISCDKCLNFPCDRHLVHVF